jgi:hypothetical protein
LRYRTVIAIVNRPPTANTLDAVAMPAAKRKSPKARRQLLLLSRVLTLDLGLRGAERSTCRWRPSGNVRIVN